MHIIYTVKLTRNLWEGGEVFDTISSVPFHRNSVQHLRADASAKSL